MSQENVDADFEVIRRAWRASGQKDLAAFERDLDPDIVTIPFGAAMEGKSYRGVDAVVGWLRDEIWANWEQFDTVPEEFTRVGDKVLVRGHWRATGKESGVELVIRATWVVEVRNGKIAYWQTYTDHEDALRDLGLGPDKSSRSSSARSAKPSKPPGCGSSERAMSQENVEMCRRAYEAFNRGDSEGMVAYLAEEFEFVPTGAVPDARGVYRGAQGYTDFLGWLRSEFDSPRVEINELTEAGDQMLASVTLRGRGKQSGVAASWDMWHLWTVRDGKAVHGQAFTSKAEALEAAGLSE